MVYGRKKVKNPFAPLGEERGRGGGDCRGEAFGQNRCS